MDNELTTKAGLGGDVKLSRLDGVPLHRQLFLVLRSSIVSGQYRRGDLFPTEEVLAKTYAVSRATVRRTLTSLEGAGLIDRRQGAGTRVAGGASFHVEDLALEAHIRTIDTICADTRLDLLSADLIEASPYLRSVLGLADDARVLRLRRTRSEDGTPIWFTYAYVSEATAKLLDPADYSTLTLWEILVKAGFAFSEIDETIGARVADADIAAALDVEIGAPLLEMFSIFIDASGDPISFQRTYSPPERRRLRFARRAEQIDAA